MNLHMVSIWGKSDTQAFRRTFIVLAESGYAAKLRADACVESEFPGYTFGGSQNYRLTTDIALVDSTDTLIISEAAEVAQ